MRFHRGVIDQDVDPTEIIFHLFDDILCAYFFGNIIDICSGAAAFGKDLINNLFDIDRRNIVCGHERCPFGQCFCQEASTAFACAGDQNNFVFQDQSLDELT